MDPKPLSGPITIELEYEGTLFRWSNMYAQNGVIRIALSEESIARHRLHDACTADRCGLDSHFCPEEGPRHMTQPPLFSLPACHRCNGTGRTRSHDGEAQLCGSCYGAGALNRDCRICGQPAGPTGYCAGHDPETARHSFATATLDASDGDLYGVRELLGHESTRTTGAVPARVGAPEARRRREARTEPGAVGMAGRESLFDAAVNETKVVKQDAERTSRLAQAEYLVGQWQEVIRLRRDLAHAEAKARGDA